MVAAAPTLPGKRAHCSPLRDRLQEGHKGTLTRSPTTSGTQGSLLQLQDLLLCAWAGWRGTGHSQPGTAGCGDLAILPCAQSSCRFGDRTRGAPSATRGTAQLRHRAPSTPSAWHSSSQRPRALERASAGSEQGRKESPRAFSIWLADSRPAARAPQEQRFAFRAGEGGGEQHGPSPASCRAEVCGETARSAAALAARSPRR